MELSMRQQLHEASKKNNNNEDEDDDHDDDDVDSRSNRSDSNKSSDKLVAANADNTHSNDVIINSNSCDVLNNSHSDEVINNGGCDDNSNNSNSCMNGDISHTSPVPAQELEPSTSASAPRRAPKLSALRASSNGTFSKPLVMTR